MGNTVLIVDDEPDIIKTVRFLLEKERIQTLVAQNGEECIEKVKNKRPDLILLDIMMPGLTTKEVISKLRENPETENIKIMYLTAVKFSEEEKREFVHLGNVVDIIEKPFSVMDLVKRVKSNLGESI